VNDRIKGIIPTGQTVPFRDELACVSGAFLKLVDWNAPLQVQPNKQIPIMREQTD
jgi:hypothetical protein